MEHTEFSSENFEFLRGFGVRQEKIAILMEAFVKKCDELDQKFVKLVQEDQNITDDMMKAIADI